MPGSKSSLWCPQTVLPLVPYSFSTFSSKNTKRKTGDETKFYPLQENYTLFLLWAVVTADAGTWACCVLLWNCHTLESTVTLRPSLGFDHGYAATFSGIFKPLNMAALRRHALPLLPKEFVKNARRKQLLKGHTGTIGAAWSACGKFMPKSQN